MSSKKTAIVDEDRPSPIKKRARIDSLSREGSLFATEEKCLLCKEGRMDGAELISHCCDRCVKESWQICITCNESLLSRTCPVCRADYAPIELYIVPGTPIRNLATVTDDDERVKLMYKFGLIRHLIGRSNVAVWSPRQQRIFLALPQEFVEDASPHFTCHTVSIPISSDRIGKDGAFLFTNQVWEEIEYEIDHGNMPANGTILSSKQETIQWILSNTRETDDQLLTMLTAEDWELMLDPTESAEAVQAIRNNIIKPNRSTTSMQQIASTAAAQAKDQVSRMADKK